MKINKQPKAQMQMQMQMKPHAAGDSINTGVLQGAHWSTEDAPVSARPMSPSTDSEVVAVAKRQRFTDFDKHRIVLASAACTKSVEIGALMTRERDKLRVQLSMHVWSSRSKKVIALLE